MEDKALPTGHISDVGVLNLLSAKTEEDFSGISRITDVGVVLVPQSLMPALLRVSMDDVGTIAPVPEGGHVVLLNGQTSLTGEALAAGSPEKLLFIVGQVFVESVVTSVGYGGIHVIGQMFAPRGSESAISGALRELVGQIVYLPPDGRLILGEDRFGREFLQALSQPTPLVILGNVEFERDVDAEILRRVVPEIVLFGNLRVPRALAPTAQALTVHKFGNLEVYD